MMEQETKEWLRNMNDEIWKRDFVDNTGMRHEFMSRELSADERSVVQGVIMQFGLPCVLHSGPYGNLSMIVYDHSDFPEIPPEPLFHIGEKHVGLPPGFQNWNERFDWFARYTHTDKNRRLLRFYGLQDSEARERYEY